MSSNFGPLLAPTGHNWQHQAQPCNTAVCPAFSVFWLCLCVAVSRHPFRSLVYASPRTWWVMSKLSKPTGDGRGEVSDGPAPQARSTQHTNSPVQLRTESLNSYTFYCAGKWATSLSDSPWGKRKISHKNQTLCLPQSWYFNPNIQRMVLPTLYFDFYSVFFFLVLLFWTVVFMGHSCTRTTVNWEIRSHGWKEETDDLFLTYLSPLPAAGGSWVAGQQTHGFPHFSSFSVVTFLWPLPKKNTKPLNTTQKRWLQNISGKFKLNCKM